MTYNVFGGTLNLTQLQLTWNCSPYSIFCISSIFCVLYSVHSHIFWSVSYIFSTFTDILSYCGTLLKSIILYCAYLTLSFIW